MKDESKSQKDGKLYFHSVSESEKVEGDKR